MQNVVILGSTGSVGSNTLEVIRQNSDKYLVIALTADSNVDKLLSQCLEFNPQYAVLLNQDKLLYFKEQLKSYNLNTEVLTGSDSLVQIVKLPHVDIVMSSIVGGCGLLPTYNAILSGKKVLLANKESLVAGGKLITEALSNNPKAQLIPVDSEHSAILQCLSSDFGNHKDQISKIILTASGGSFRKLAYEEIANVTPEMALTHPNWSMGKKISVDSSTMMNKGLEVIEAYWLFGIDMSKIEVVVHPQSIIHSMVEYIDGSVIAQLGIPDMKIPIAYALAYPKRIKSGSAMLDFTKLSNLSFESPDYKRFPCLKLAFDALNDGGAMPAILNAANEIAVAAFLEYKIGFYDINRLIESAMKYFCGNNYNSIEDLLEIDAATRKYTLNLIN